MIAFALCLLVLTSVSSSQASDVSKENFQQKFPELVHWYERAADRVLHNAKPSPEDLKEVRDVLKLGKQKVYDFVTSPLYDIFSSMIIERAVNIVSPLLGILPPKEFREFMRIINKQPELVKYIFNDEKDEASIVKILPNAAVFDNWFSNNTKRIVDEVVDSTSAVDDVVLGDFDVLPEDGEPGAPGGSPGAPGAPGGSPGAPGGSAGAPGGSPGAPGAPGARSFSY